MPSVWFEPTISACERPQTYVLDCAVTGTGLRKRYRGLLPGQKRPGREAANFSQFKRLRIPKSRPMGPPHLPSLFNCHGALLCSETSLLLFSASGRDYTWVGKQSHVDWRQGRLKCVFISGSNSCTGIYKLSAHAWFFCGGSEMTLQLAWEVSCFHRKTHNV